MAASYADSIRASTASTVHYNTCPNHFTSITRKCNGKKRDGGPCSRAAKVFEAQVLPTCKIHAWQNFPSGVCQAIESCGQPCLRLAPYHPPYHLCEVHCGGTDTLPCHLLRLPTELRLEIFRYLFPESIPESIPDHMYRPPGWADVEPYTPIFKTNRQIHEEAAAILYGESMFSASISAHRIYFMRKRWLRYLHARSVKFTHWNIEGVISPMAAERVRHLEVSVQLGSHFDGGDPAMKGISSEEREILLLRDSLRKFVELLGNDDIGRKLYVKPLISFVRNWRLEEVQAALVLMLEPFKGLRSVASARLDPARINLHIYSGNRIIRSIRTTIGAGGENENLIASEYAAYEEYQQSWAAELEHSFPMAAKSPLTLFVLQKNAKMLLRQLEKVVGLIYEQDYKTRTDGKAGLPSSSPFVGIERPLHFARLAYEQRDIKILTRIQDAILKRWVDHQRKLQTHSLAMANTISDMFVSRDEPQFPTELYPEALTFTEYHTLSVRAPDVQWRDLDIKDDCPKSDDPGVEFWQDRENHYFAKEGKKWMRLKFPSLIGKR